MNMIIIPKQVLMMKMENAFQTELQTLQKQHESLYWEHNQNQAIRWGDYYAHKANGAKVELYDLIADPQQENDISEENIEKVERIKKMMADSHRPSDVWPSPGERRTAFLNRMEMANIPERPDNVGHY